LKNSRLQADGGGRDFFVGPQKFLTWPARQKKSSRDWTVVSDRIKKNPQPFGGWGLGGWGQWFGYQLRQVLPQRGEVRRK
jgi:hypothetical protein